MKNKYQINKIAIAILNLLALTGMLLPISPAKAQTTQQVQIVAQTLTSGDVHLEAPTQQLRLSSGDINDMDPDYPYQKTFIISAYYSPVPGQDKYVTGSYQRDIKLNGGGVHGADGTDVYPGMIAAPKSYKFGLKIQIPGLGTATVHDRGGAIVHSGERNNAHDRLDVWMGYGDAGRIRAMKWGKRTVAATVLGNDPSIKDFLALDGFSVSEKYAVKNTLTPSNEIKSPSLVATADKSAQVIAQKQQGPNLEAANYGEKGEKVKKIQQILKNLNYYNGEINATFDSRTLTALTKFQVSEKIVPHEKAFGAGYVGPRTLQVLASKSNVLVAHAKEETFTPNSVFNQDLKLGDSGDGVRTLQAELRKVNLLGLEETGYYGEVTAHAVFKFQQINGLVGDEKSIYAGVFGVKTRATFNSILNERQRTQNMVAARQKEELD